MTETIIGPDGNYCNPKYLEKDMSEKTHDPRRAELVRKFGLSKTAVNAMTDDDVDTLCNKQLPGRLGLAIVGDIKEKLKWHKFPVLDDGFVCLVDVMGDDAAIVQAARVSYGRDTRDGRPTNQSKIDGGNWGPDLAPDPQQEEKNRTLIRYLMRHRHSTPFEMAEIKLLVRVPMDTWRQWIRHRTANVNEYSTRYSEAINAMQKTLPTEWRLQSNNNKQGSDGFLPETTKSIMPPKPTDGTDLSAAEERLHKEARHVYEERLKAGVAREQARKDLPLSTYTEAYWKIDLHNMLHFLTLRMDSHAQKEIRDYATIIGDNIIKPLFPLVWEAFEDYRLGAISLTRLDILMMQLLIPLSSDKKAGFEFNCNRREEFQLQGWHDPKCRERNECQEKLERLGLL